MQEIGPRVLALVRVFGSATRVARIRPSAGGASRCNARVLTRACRRDYRSEAGNESTQAGIRAPAYPVGALLPCPSHRGLSPKQAMNSPVVASVGFGRVSCQHHSRVLRLRSTDGVRSEAPVVWFEVVSKDGERVNASFSDLFGWETTKVAPGSHDGVMDANPHGIGRSQQGPGHVTFFVEVDDLENTSRGRGLGGKEDLVGARVRWRRSILLRRRKEREGEDRPPAQARCRDGPQLRDPRRPRLASTDEISFLMNNATPRVAGGWEAAFLNDRYADVTNPSLPRAAGRPLRSACISSAPSNE